MIVGIISDTHDNIMLARKAARVFKEKHVDLVLHLGDIVAPFTLRVFAEEGVGKIIAVYGNNCGERLGLLRTAQKLGYEIHEPPFTLELAGKKVLMMHGQGPPEETVAIAESIAFSKRYDIVLYGHTHRPDNRLINGTLLLNPGEACGCLTGHATVAILDLNTMRVEIVELARVPEESRVKT